MENRVQMFENSTEQLENEIKLLVQKQGLDKNMQEKLKQQVFELREKLGYAEH